MRQLTIDCELTGFGLDLITAYFGVFDGYYLVDELYLELIPDNGIFRVNPESMGVNQIDLRNWQDNAIKYKDAKSLLYSFLENNSKDGRLTTLGQGVNGDIKYIQEYLISKGSWEKFVNILVIDTLYIATFLKDQGKLNIDSLSLESLCIYFNLDITNLHNAKTDALLTRQVYEKLKQL